jgi:hypothetical protein
LEAIQYAKTDREKYFEFYPAVELAELNDVLEKSCNALLQGRITFYENHIVRLAMSKKSDDAAKMNEYKERLVLQHTTFSSHTDLDGALYDPSKCIHPALWKQAKAFMGI